MGSWRRSSPGSTLTTAARSIATSCGPPLSSTPRSARPWASRSRPSAHLATADERERARCASRAACGQEPRRTHRTRVGTWHGGRDTVLRLSTWLVWHLHGRLVTGRFCVCRSAARERPRVRVVPRLIRAVFYIYLSIYWVGKK